MILSKQTFKFFLLGTILILLYVHQQTAILRLSYSIEKKEKQLVTLNENYKMARYQRARLRSPAFLNREMKKRALNLTNPKAVEVVNISMPRMSAAPVSVGGTWPVKSPLLSWIGSIKEAQAKTSK